MVKEIFYDNGILNKNKLREKWIKKHYHKEYDKIIEYTKTILLDKFSSKIYHYINKIKTIPKCKQCNINNSRFIGFSKGYDKCCSKSCASKFSIEKGIKTR